VKISKNNYMSVNTNPTVSQKIWKNILTRHFSHLSPVSLTPVINLYLWIKVQNWLHGILRNPGKTDKCKKTYSWKSHPLNNSYICPLSVSFYVLDRHSNYEFFLNFHIPYFSFCEHPHATGFLGVFVTVKGLIKTNWKPTTIRKDF
jgi:hypothetical protein